MQGLLGKKIGMTQIFTAEGNAVPVTVIDSTSCTVVGRRTQEKDGYTAVVLGLIDAKEKHLTKAQLGSFKKAGAPAKRIVKEFRVSEDVLNQFNPGDKVPVEAFKQKQLVDVTGITKGRGFQGVMKRWDFHGFGKTHGTHEYRRHPGAIGQRKTPGRVFPKKKMPGHYGAEQVTVRNLEIIDIIPERNLILVKGGIAGHNNGVVMLKSSLKTA